MKNKRIHAPLDSRVYGTARCLYIDSKNRHCYVPEEMQLQEFKDISDDIRMKSGGSITMQDGSIQYNQRLKDK